MSKTMYVMYDPSTNLLFTHPRTGKVRYNTYRGAKAARTRLFTTDWEDTTLPRLLWIVTEKEYNERHGNKTKTVKNLMTGKNIEIPLNTPLCCDPSSETYWSM